MHVGFLQTALLHNSWEGMKTNCVPSSFLHPCLYHLVEMLINWFLVWFFLAKVSITTDFWLSFFSWKAGPVGEEEWPVKAQALHRCFRGGRGMY